MEKPSLDTAKAGAMRFNTDSSQMEIYDGNQWTGILATSPFQQTGGTRGLWAGRNSPHTDAIDFVTIEITGNASDFGNLVTNTGIACAMSSRIRGVIAGGTAPNDSGNSDKMDFVTIASTGNATDFGNLITARHGCMGLGDSTRGLIIGGRTPSRLNSIEYITIAATGNAQDFGDVDYTNGMRASGAFSSPTRGVFAGGADSPGNNAVNIIHFVTLASTGCLLYTSPSPRDS